MLQLYVNDILTDLMACSKTAAVSCSVHFFSSSVHFLQCCDQLVASNVFVDSDDKNNKIDIIARTGMHFLIFKK